MNNTILMAVLATSFSVGVALAQGSTPSSREIMTGTRIACTSIPHEKGTPLSPPCMALIAMMNMDNLFNLELENVPWMLAIIEFNHAIAFENKEKILNMMDKACKESSEDLGFCDPSL